MTDPVPETTRTQRAAERYALALRVQLPNGEGETRNISAGGIYFACDRGFEEGAAIEFTVEFDAGLGLAPMLLRCKGRVVRVDEMDGRVGVAAKVESQSIEVRG